MLNEREIIESLHFKESTGFKEIENSYNINSLSIWKLFGKGMEKMKKAHTDRSLYVITFITLIGAILRIYHIGFKPLWLDEAVLYWISNSDSLKDVITQNALRNSTPPLFPILIRYISILGDTEKMLRLIPMIAGTASIPAIYYLFREFINKYPAFVLTLMVAVAPTQIKFSQELREYSLTFLLSTLILLFFSRYLNKQDTKDLIILSIFMCFGIFTQYGISLLIICLNLIYLFTLIANKENRKSRLLRWVLSQIVTLAAALLVIYLSLQEQSHFFEASKSPSHYLYNAYWNGSVRSLLNFIIKNTYALLRFSFSSNIFLFLIIIGFIFLTINFNSFSLPLLLFMVPMIMTVLLAALGIYPYHGDRQDIFLTPMIYMIAGFGINYLWDIDKKRWAILILLFFPITAGIIQSWNYLNSPGAENIIPVVEKLKELKGEHDSVYVYYAAKPAFDYYVRDLIISNVIYGTSNREDANKYLIEIDNTFSPNDSVWYVFSHCWKNECNLIRNHLSKTNNVDVVVKENNAYLYFVY